MNRYAHYPLDINTTVFVVLLELSQSANHSSKKILIVSQIRFALN